MHRGAFSQQEIKCLIEEFHRLGDEHWQHEIHRFARLNLAPSIMRAFKKNSSEAIRDVLVEIDVERFRSFRRYEHFRAWFECELDRLANAIRRTNKGNTRIFPGYKWGHAAKILNLFLRDIICHCRIFEADLANRVEPWLFLPVDQIVMKRMRAIGFRLPFQRIKDIDSAEKFYLIQDALLEAAKAAGVARVWFDDVWSIRVLVKKAGTTSED